MNLSMRTFVVKEPYENVFKKRRRTFVSIGLIFLLIYSITILPHGKAAPVIIDEDSYGSWEDNFDDTTGIESWNNLTMIDDNIKLDCPIYSPVKYQGNPIITNGGGGWKDIRTSDPCVIWDDKEYKMWFYGYDLPGGSGGHYRIGYANSTNGYDWTEYPGNPVLVNGTPGSWDELHVYNPYVIKQGGLYHLWYTGRDDAQVPYQIGYANSTDGITWTKHPDPVLTPSQTGWDDYLVSSCCVIYEDNLFKMWYSGHDGSSYRIGYATSSDGINWSRYSQNPVLDLGFGGEWDSSKVYSPTVITNGGIYRMWYTGNEGGNYAIGYAFSTDGTSWSKYSENPILSPGPESWDDSIVSGPSALKLNEEDYFIYYHGEGSEYQIGLANLTLPMCYGNLTSTEIVLPYDQTWESLVINKSEGGIGDSIVVSILDGKSYQPILGFENLTGTEIDISAIDHEEYPAIRLEAHFFCNGTDSPILHGWKVTWLDTIAPETPTGFSVINPWTGYSLVLYWNANTEPDVDYYVIHYSTDNFTFFWLVNLSSDTISFEHFGLTQGDTYYYKIAAADEVPNQSNFTEVVEGVPDKDMDGDGIGDMKDPDIDGDTIANENDTFPMNENEWIDTDEDTIGDNADMDDDGDGYYDVDDAFPLNDTEWFDTDNDGIGNNNDTDDDNDGVPDNDDDLPYNPYEVVDTDGDGTGNNGDIDDDDDGVPDSNDDFPLNDTEYNDADGDGTGDNTDTDDDNDGYNDTIEADEGSDPLNPGSIPSDNDRDFIPDSIDIDDDNDGVPDDEDDLPYNSNEAVDTDGDGTGNNGDIDDDDDGVPDSNDDFPLDNTEYNDLDGDGTGDNSDEDMDGDGVINTNDSFPSDSTEWYDSDGDHIGDNKDSDIDGDGIRNSRDEFPYDMGEWGDLDSDGEGDNSDLDRDGDGVPNESDDFPDNELEWEDTDTDGKGNNADMDDDDDGYSDVIEQNLGSDPLDSASKPSDFDSDGLPDAVDIDDDDDTHPDVEDAYPYDGTKWREPEEPNELLLPIYLVIVLLVILIIICAVLIARTGRAKEKIGDYEKVLQERSGQGYSEESVDRDRLIEQTQKPQKERRPPPPPP